MSLGPFLGLTDDARDPQLRKASFSALASPNNFNAFFQDLASQACLQEQGDHFERLLLFFKADPRPLRSTSNAIAHALGPRPGQ